MNLTTLGGDNGNKGSHGEQTDKQAYIQLSFHESRQFYWPATYKKVRSWKHTDGDVSRREVCPSPIQNSIDENSEGRKVSEAQTQFDTSVVIFEYLALLRTKQIYHIHKNEMREFAQLILNNKEILSSFTTLGFVNHVLSLETQFFEYKDRIDLAPEYQAVINSIETYAEMKAENGEDLTDEDKKVSFYCELRFVIDIKCHILH